MSESDKEEWYQAALEVAKRAAKVARAAFEREDKAVQTKASSADLVTETDKQVEELIFSFLREKFPSHCFIGEESVGEEGAQLTDAPTWMVDPIDGTSNFVHRFPFSCVSIATAVNKEVVVGVVYNFVLEQMFAAKKGGGATMNGEPIHVSQCTGEQSHQPLLRVHSKCCCRAYTGISGDSTRQPATRTCAQAQAGHHHGFGQGSQSRAWYSCDGLCGSEHVPGGQWTG
jgi:fructose-1,6-bisphosphatase/inositol monophosphatase family enzyme